MRGDANLAAICYQDFFRGVDSNEALAAGGQFAKGVEYVIAYAAAHMKK
jgi:hypothetical protein